MDIIDIGNPNGTGSEFGNGSTFPQIICNDKKLGGCTDTIQFLKEHQIV